MIITWLVYLIGVAVAFICLGIANDMDEKDPVPVSFIFLSWIMVILTIGVFFKQVKSYYPSFKKTKEFLRTFFSRW